MRTSSGGNISESVKERVGDDRGWEFGRDGVRYVLSKLKSRESRLDGEGEENDEDMEFTGIGDKHIEVSVRSFQNSEPVSG